MDEQLENRLRFLRKANTEGMPHSDRGLACPPKSDPVIMQIVQLAETRERLHAKADQPRPDRLDPPGHPGRPRRRIERQPGVPQGRYQSDHLLPMEGPPGGSRIERTTPHV